MVAENMEQRLQNLGMVFVGKEIHQKCSFLIIGRSALWRIKDLVNNTILKNGQTKKQMAPD